MIEKWGQIQGKWELSEFKLPGSYRGSTVFVNLWNFFSKVQI